MQQQIEVFGEWASLATLLAFTDSMDTWLQLSPDQSYLMRLVIEEIATNIIKYGYNDDQRGVIQLACSCEGDTLRITIRDQGRPFDPRDCPLPDLSHNDATERGVGGLGIFFVRELADHLVYSHDPYSGWNELTVTKGRAL